MFCVARERELARLTQHLDQALSGEGRVVFVKGDSGSGKTTLISAFVQRAMRSHADLVAASGQCNAYTGIGDPYLPFVEILEMLSGDITARRAGAAITREHARRLGLLFTTTLQALLEMGPALLDVMISGAGLLARAEALLSDAPTWQAQLEERLRRRGAGAVSETSQQAALFAQYTRVLQILSRDRPLVLVLDDLQWADAGSLGLLFHLGRRLQGSRILIVAAYRTEEVALGRDGEPHPLEPLVNEFQQVWGEVTVDLAEADGRGLVEELVDSEPNRLGAAFRQALFQHTDGQALFTVELLRGLQSRGVLQRDDAGRWVQTATLDWATLPTRVESVIAQQIGRLPAAWRGLLAAASVEGEAFTAEIVAQVRGTDERETLHVLNGVLSSRYHLVDAHAMRRIGSQRLSRYRFRHHLFQHYLYQRLNPVERARLHEEVGDALQALYGAVPEFIFETWPVVGDRLAALYGPRATDVAAILPQLAWHYRAASLVDKAAAYLSQAACSAVGSFALTEAAGHATQGVALIQSLPFTLERARQEMAFQATLSISYRLARGSSYPAVDRAIERLCELARQTGDDVRLIWGLYGRSHAHWNRAEYYAAIELAGEMLELAQCAAPDLLPDIHFYLGGALWASTGHLAVARQYLDPLLGPGSTQGTLRPWPGRVAPMSGVPPLVYWCAGYPDLALTLAEEAVDLTPSGYGVFFRNGYLLARRLRREAHAVLQGAQTMLPETSEEGVSAQHGAALYWLGWARAQLGLPEQGIAEMRQALDIWRQRGTRLNQTFWLAGLAEGYALAGQPEEGLQVIADALEHVELTDERWYEAELHRLRGELLQQRGDDPEQIEACFRQAIAIAQQQEAKAWELRATTSLCRLLQGQDRGDEARQTLSAVLGWFTEGFDTPDLQEASALLSALAA
ncbi:MAG: AAA family ATPase [Anaerolineae bacterium]|nr:AAA family ATPase [Anaerolineae bacterium]